MIGFLELIDSQEDKNRFVEIYNKYCNLVYWIAYQHTHNHELSEECVQETFLSIAKNFYKVGPADDPRTKGYVSTIALGYAINAYRKELTKDVVSLDGDELEYEILKASKETENELENFDAIDLSVAMDKALTEEERLYIHLKYTYQFSVSEMARMFSTTDYYINKKLNIALDKLKKYLESKI